MLTIDQILRVGKMMAQCERSPREQSVLANVTHGRETSKEAISLVLGYVKTPGGDIAVRRYTSEEERQNDPDRVE